ncbi:putative pentatricopeptide repeat-containing protein [Hordeum vulgare]|nr:putative pentatricopeptide repeat-containing protein [Hordeum vulgare]
MAPSTKPSIQTQHVLAAMAETTDKLQGLLESVIRRLDASQTTADERFQAQLAFNEQVSHELKNVPNKLTSLRPMWTRHASRRRSPIRPRQLLRARPLPSTLQHHHQGSINCRRRFLPWFALRHTRFSTPTVQPRYHSSDWSTKGHRCFPCTQ